MEAAPGRLWGWNSWVPAPVSLLCLCSVQAPLKNTPEEPPTLAGGSQDSHPRLQTGERDSCTAVQGGSTSLRLSYTDPYPIHLSLQTSGLKGTESFASGFSDVQVVPFH